LPGGGGFSAQKTSQEPNPAARLQALLPAHEKKETHMVGLLDLLNQEKAERAAERRAEFVHQQQLGGQGTMPSSKAGDSTSLEMMKKAMNMSKFGRKERREEEEGAWEAGQQAGQTLREEESHGALHKAAQQGRGILLMSPIVLGGGGGEGDKQRMNVGR
jgi:hypothetical protein